MSDRATSNGTRAHVARRVASGLAETAFRSLGRTGLLTSVVGIGCYRIDERPQHAEALVAALRAGLNLVDTSTNYTDGASERTVGRVLRALLDRGEVDRTEVIVVSKVGYLQGENLEAASARAQSGSPYPEIVRYAEGCWHCIHPDFIHDQLTRSLERTGLASLDAYLLHNPEYFLADASHRGNVPLSDARSELDARLARAFEALEEEVAAGRIGAYGVSSNTFVARADDPEAISVSRTLDIARASARARGEDEGAHHLAIVQLPFNLLEPGAAVERNTGADGSMTPLQFAASAGIGVLANRPLNAFRGRSLVRLADFPLERRGTSAAEAVTRVAALEEEFRRTVAPALQEDDGAPVERFFAWAEELGSAANRFSGVEHWTQVEEDFIRPRLDHLLSHVSLHLAGKARNDWSAFKARYVPAMEDLLAAIGDRYREQAQATSDGVAKRLDPSLPRTLRDEPLSRKAASVVASTPGVSCVLMGLRRKAYVEDALGVLAIPPVPVDESLFRALA